MWRIHRHIGMVGDQAAKALTDERTEQEQGDDPKRLCAEPKSRGDALER